MANLLSFPMRLGPNGAFVTRDEDDAAYYAELIGVLTGTREGERLLCPMFGLSDPTFTDFDAQELAHKVELFGPPVRILSVTTTYVSDHEANVRVDFVQLEPDGQTFNTDNL